MLVPPKTGSQSPLLLAASLGGSFTCFHLPVCHFLLVLVCIFVLFLRSHFLLSSHNILVPTDVCTPFCPYLWMPVLKHERTLPFQIWHKLRYAHLHSFNILFISSSSRNSKRWCLDFSDFILGDTNCFPVRTTILYIPYSVFSGASVDSFYLFEGKNTETLSKTQYTRMWERIIKKRKRYRRSWIKPSRYKPAIVLL